MIFLRRFLLTGMGLTIASLILVPWQQSVFGIGRVIAYAASERQQTVEAPVEGRVIRWFAQEGDAVKAGEPLVELVDNDPDVLSRLSRERDAALAQVETTKLAIQLSEARIVSLETARDAALQNARLRVDMARDRLDAAQRANDAATAALEAASLNLTRLERLVERGLVSTREHELGILESRRAENDVARAVATLRAAKAEVEALVAERETVGQSQRANIESTQAALEGLRGSLAKAEAELAKTDVRRARQDQLVVRAPQSGVLFRIISNPGAQMLKAGDPLAVLVPDSDARAVELFVSGNDAPLLDPGRPVRLQFEGWPAVQFVGWPSVAIGTFGGIVGFVDSHDDGMGRFRVVIVPSTDEPWPDKRYLRQGVRTNGWVLLNQVSLGFELWRQLNGFPPALKNPPELSKPGSDS